MAYQTIEYEVRDGVATITLNRPDRLNACDNRMTAELIAVLDAVDEDDAVRAVIVTGAGRAFCAGADLSEGAAGFLTEEAGDAPDYASPAARDGGGMIALRLFKCLKPVIAAINGPAVGIGATMTLPMDIRIASDAARFGFVFARRGIVPEAASSFFLPKVVGISQALRWCYSGALFPAAEALRAGLVSEVHAPEALLDAARAIARAIADNTAPVSIALTRQMLWRGCGLADPMDAHRIDSRAILSRSRSADAAEGVGAFFEKRAPDFPGRVSRDMPDFFPWWDEPSYR